MTVPPGYRLDLQALVEEAIAKGQPDTVPEAMEYHHASLLVAAAIHGEYDLVDRLLTAGAKITGDDLCDIFWWGAGPKSVAFFVDRGIPLNGGCLLNALRHSHWNTVFALLDAGIGVQTPVHVDRGDGSTTMLHVAAYKGEIIALEQLLERGADTEVFDDEGFTPLMKACHFKYKDVTLHTGSSKAAGILLKNGANPNVRTPEGETPLLLCVAERIPEHIYKVRNDVVKVLLNYGADPNAVSPVGTTALMLAARDNDAPLIRSLLKAGADRNLRTPDGKTALDVAVKWKSKEAAELLRQA